MIKNARRSGSLLLVFAGLLLATLACYTGQVPGVFEITPYYTPTPLPEAENPRFQVMEMVLAPSELGHTFFNMTRLPEPLEPSLLNSKAICQPNSAAQVLYAGEGGDGVRYYLLQCRGTVGWAAEHRLVGPMEFQQGDLAITVSATGQPLQLLDERSLQPMPVSPFSACQPETIVTVYGINAAESEDSQTKQMLYLVECPAGVRGWATNADLFGPVRINIEDRALVLNANGSAFRLASEPAPLSAANAVEGDCPTGSVLKAQSARLIGETVYFEVACGDTEGWVDQQDLVGPLRFDIGTRALIHVEPVLIFEDELPIVATGEAAIESETVSDDDSPESTLPEGDGPASVGQGSEIRNVVQYTPPVYLTDKPGPAVRTGDDMNVVGQCVTNTGARLLDYAGVDDLLYYRVTCDECVETNIDADGEEPTCTRAETREGWVDQQVLQGPVEYLAGEVATFVPNSAAVEADETTGIRWMRIPTTTAGAASIGRFTDFAGRCPVDALVTITGLQLEKARTSSNYTFYYEVECEGQPAVNIMETDASGKTRPVVHYVSNELTPISGILSGRDLEARQE